MAIRRAIVPGLVALGALWVASAWAQEAEKAEVPLEKVVLFNSGVGYFEHRAKIDGNARVELKFKVNDINDLLKSMVLEDLGGGRISTVTYDSRDPITRTLQTFAIDLTSSPTLADLLRQIRGEKIQVDAPQPITGTIISLETRQEPAGEKQTVEVTYLNLLTDEGLRSVALPSVTRIKLLDEKLNAELQQALSILAMAHATDKKSVTLNFRGQGERPVRIGYIQEAPIWKTSYRLVLRDEEAPFLQGWALVENPTEEDWKGVNLTLVSGRPISFIMDLYEPLYVDRPVVEPELYASLRPRVYEQDLNRADKEFQQAREQMRLRDMPAPPGAPADALARGKAAANGQRAQAIPGVAGSGFGGRAVEAAAEDAEFEPGFAYARSDRGVQSVAQAAEVGELFQYVIETPVTLPRQQSAMLPIVNQSVEGEKVSIYNHAVHPKHPLNGLRLTNSTDLHLMQGPITVFDGGAYAGDARIEDLPPGSERLVSYALDLDVEVAPRSKAEPEQLVAVKLVKGVAHVSRKYERSQEYLIKNSGDRARDLLIEYPFDPSWKLVQPEDPAEKTRDVYRFALTVEPGEPETLEVEEERVISQQVALTNLDDGTIQVFLSSKVVSEPVKEALAEVVRRKLEIQKVAQQRAQLEQQVAAIDQEQARIRQNMDRLNRNSELYNRYVQKFSEQEDRIEELREEIHQLSQEEMRLRQALDKYLSELTVM